MMVMIVVMWVIRAVVSVMCGSALMVISALNTGDVDGACREGSGDACAQHGWGR
ncbi:hypothetical protein [Streptomyces sp. NPDC003077]|uniref:hypothetical protein n=1 Tax=Streptomyces sp. NPDC003077 TaxID=3154443 RepID=UPI0033A8DB24